MSRMFAIHLIYNLGYRVRYGSVTQGTKDHVPEDIVKQLLNSDKCKNCLDQCKRQEPSELSLQIHLREITNNDKIHKFQIKEENNEKNSTSHISIVPLDISDK